jgi:hypothetical protein
MKLNELLACMRRETVIRTVISGIHVTLFSKKICDLVLPTGKICVTDAGLLDEGTLDRTLYAGSFPVHLVTAASEGDPSRTYLCQVCIEFRETIAVRCVRAVPGAIGLDNASLAIMDAGVQELVEQLYPLGSEKSLLDDCVDQSSFGVEWYEMWFNLPSSDESRANVLVFLPEMGDGYYPMYWGLDENDNTSMLIIDFREVPLDVPRESWLATFAARWMNWRR